VINRFKVLKAHFVGENAGFSSLTLSIGLSQYVKQASVACWMLSGLPGAEGFSFFFDIIAERITDN